jgi:transposase-like protein
LATVAGCESRNEKDNMNASAVAVATQNEKMVDKNLNEDLRVVRLHTQSNCFFCGSPWYLSEGKRVFHKRKMTEDPVWKLPTSCPECRAKSRVSATQAHISKCPSGKQEFKSDQDARTYNQEVLEKRGFRSQRSYECPDCHLFHLTSQPVEVSSGALASPLGKAVASAETKKPIKKLVESRSAVAQLLALGRSVSKIAEELNMTATNVYYHKRKLDEKSAVPKATVARVKASVARVLDERDLDTEEQSLQRQLEVIQRRKVTLAEARMLRVDLVNGAIRIVKEGEHMLLAFGERDQLVSLLTTIKQPESTACEAAR